MPDFDREVLVPLRAKQAELERQRQEAKRLADEKAAQDAREAAETAARAEAEQVAARAAATRQATSQAATTAIGSDIVTIIAAAANRYGLDPGMMLRIARCESSLNPNAVAPNLIAGTHPSGLFQHVLTYWPARAVKYGYPGASVFDPVANANVTAAMMASEGTGAWECR